tara:strand:- start:263 stop:484 length:222 start_codon:yes stop_codon:yes gene_type:complete
MNNLLKELIYEILMLEGNKPPKWLVKSKKAIYKGKIVKVVEADGPGPMSIIKLRDGRGKTKQVMTKHLSKAKK